MSKKSCLIAVVVAVILVIILLACAGICVLLSSVFSDYDWSSFQDTSQSETVVEGGDEKIVVIKVEGLILDVEESGDLWGNTYASSQKITKYIDDAMSDDDVGAIILSLDTPGGDVYASDLIYQKVLEAQASGIKVVTLMKGTAASGGYYIAASSDKIVASPLTITGSIGVLIEVTSYSGLYEKLGIETRIITNSGADYKTGEGLFDEDPAGEEDKIYQEIVDEAFDRFVTIVSEGRGLEKDKVLEIADGRILTGSQAKELFLVDELGDFEEAVLEAEKLAGISNATILEYKEYDFWSSLMGYVANITNPTVEILKGVDLKPGPKLMYLYVED